MLRFIRTEGKCVDATKSYTLDIKNKVQVFVDCSLNVFKKFYFFNANCINILVIKLKTGLFSELINVTVLPHDALI